MSDKAITIDKEPQQIDAPATNFSPSPEILFRVAMCKSPVLLAGEVNALANDLRALQDKLTQMERNASMALIAAERALAQSSEEKRILAAAVSDAGKMIHDVCIFCQQQKATSRGMCMNSGCIVYHSNQILATESVPVPADKDGHGKATPQSDDTAPVV